MRIIILGLAFLLASALTAPVYAETKLDSPIRLQLSWRHQFQFAGYYAALAKGFYKEAGLNVELLEGGPGTYCTESVLKQVEYCNASGSIVKQRIEGQPIVVLASIIQHSPIVLITKKSANLVTPRDLIGKDVEMLLSGEPILEIQAMFRNQNINLDELKLHENNLSISVLLDGSVDAFYGFSTNEPFQLLRQGVEYNIISPRQYGVDFYGDVLLTSEQELKNYPYRAAAFREASLRGWRYAMSHRLEIASLIIEKYAPQMSSEKLLLEAKAIEELMLPNLIEIGHSNPERWRHTADTLVSFGIIDPDYSLEGFIYDPDVSKIHASIIRLLLAILVLITTVMAALWLFNNRLNREISERIAVQERLRLDKELSDKIANTDDLSGLGSRRSFYERGRDALKQAETSNSPLSMILLDIDHFKRVNDGYGHLTGDQVICEVANIILKMIRSSDIQGRIGGEEFAILLPDTEPKGAVELAERIRHAIAEIALESDGDRLVITASFGVASYDQSTDNIKSLMQSCDTALYKAKDQGRNRVVSS